MTIGNFHADGKVSEEELLRRSSSFLEKAVASFRQMAANGNFSFGGIKLQDADLNRVHSIVTEIDSRRLFFACGDDEMPHYAMQSLYEVRSELRKESKGVWADPSCERIIQDIAAALNDACTSAERLGGQSVHMGTDKFFEFIDVLADMRLKVWVLVAVLTIKLGSVIRPRNLPPEILRQAERYDL